MNRHVWLLRDHLVKCECFLDMDISALLAEEVTEEGVYDALSGIEKGDADAYLTLAYMYLYTDMGNGMEEQKRIAMDLLMRAARTGRMTWPDMYYYAMLRLEEKGKYDEDAGQILIETITEEGGLYFLRMQELTEYLNYLSYGWNDADRFAFLDPLYERFPSDAEKHLFFRRKEIPQYREGVSVLEMTGLEPQHEQSRTLDIARAMEETLPLRITGNGEEGRVKCRKCLADLLMIDDKYVYGRDYLDKDREFRCYARSLLEYGLYRIERTVTL